MVKDTIILSADTSSLKFSIALLKGVKLIAQYFSKGPNRQSSDMLPEIGRLLSENSHKIEDIGLFSIGIGPGSFTGLRIGITAMRAMAFALRRPVIGIPSIDAIAYAVTSEEADTCVIIDAKQEKLYVRFYRKRGPAIKPIGKIELLSIERLLARIKRPVLFAGDGIAIYKDVILKAKLPRVNFAAYDKWFPKASAIGKLSFDKLKQGHRDSVLTLSPLYIYPKECSIRKQRKKL